MSETERVEDGEGLELLVRNMTHDELTRHGLALRDIMSNGTRIYERDNILYAFVPESPTYRLLVRTLKSVEVDERRL